MLSTVGFLGLSSMKPIINASVLKLADIILVNGAILDAFEDVFHMCIPFYIAVGVLGITLEGIKLSLPSEHDLSVRS